MEFINSFFGVFPDYDLFSIPFGQVLIFVILNSLCLLFARYKLGLLVTYCFVFYWGFISNRAYFIDKFGNTSWGLVIYSIAGISMIAIFILGFLQGRRD